MKILVVSDTHGDNRHYYDVLELEKDPDMVIHCGDILGSQDELRRAVECPFYWVPGNMDMFAAESRVKVIPVAGHTIYVAHGHEHGVRMGTEVLASAALSEDADIALFGHTHIPEIDNSYESEYGVRIMNPGSLSQPRQADRRPSYGLILIDEDGAAELKLKYLT